MLWYPQYEIIFFETFPKEALVFTCLQYKSIENTVGKGEIARNEQFLLVPQCFYPLEELTCIFIKFKIIICKLSVWKSLIFFSFGKGLKNIYKCAGKRNRWKAWIDMCTSTLSLIMISNMNV